MLKVPKDVKIILASQSPRRQQLLKGLDIDFSVKVLDVPEEYPGDLLVTEVPAYLSKVKSKAYNHLINNKSIVITADTIVLHNGNIIEKPSDKRDAKNLLNTLSGSKHTVITGVTLNSGFGTKTFSAYTDVYFRKIEDEEIEYYIEQYKPFDKAGSYGIQEWIGYIAIEKIEGSYFNVMGLPTQQLYIELQKLLSKYYAS